ncbi:MAG: 3-oxoacyl-[acyl-carrier-protein] reductase [Dehalococcoidia bacterium]
MSSENKKVVLVTGGARGIGRSIVLNMSKNNYDIIINYNQSAVAANDLAKEVKNISDSKIKVVQADVSNESQVQKMFLEISQEFSGVDVLINNAGITKDALSMRMKIEDWDNVINTNLRGSFLCSQAAIKSMMSNRWGRIINISSVIGIHGNLGQSNYSASKSGLIGLTKSLSKELASRNITVNAIAPGFIKTEMVETISEKIQEGILSRISMNRFGESEDVAYLVEFLASEKANYITGQVITVDGGLAL